VFVAVLHDPLLPVHADVFDELHSRQAPLTQAGVAVVGHALAPPEPKSPVQTMQPPPWQTGNPAGQFAEFEQV
jgi:hypothetical protein